MPFVAWSYVLPPREETIKHTWESLRALPKEELKHSKISNEQLLHGLLRYKDSIKSLETLSPDGDSYWTFNLQAQKWLKTTNKSSIQYFLSRLEAPTENNLKGAYTTWDSFIFHYKSSKRGGVNIWSLSWKAPVDEWEVTQGLPSLLLLSRQESKVLFLSYDLSTFEVQELPKEAELLRAFSCSRYEQALWLNDSKGLGRLFILSKGKFIRELTFESAALGDVVGIDARSCQEFYLASSLGLFKILR